MPTDFWLKTGSLISTTLRPSRRRFAGVSPFAAKSASRAWARTLLGTLHMMDCAGYREWNAVASRLPKVGRCAAFAIALACSMPVRAWAQAATSISIDRTTAQRLGALEGPAIQLARFADGPRDRDWRRSAAPTGHRRDGRARHGDVPDPGAAADFVHSGARPPCAPSRREGKPRNSRATTCRVGGVTYGGNDARHVPAIVLFASSFALLVASA